MDPEKQALYAQLPDGNADLRITGRFPAMLKEQQATVEKSERNVGNNEAQVIAAVSARVALIRANIVTKLSESDVLLVAVYAYLVDIAAKNADLITRNTDIAAQAAAIVSNLNNATTNVNASAATAGEKTTINGFITAALANNTNISTDQAAIVTDTTAITSDASSGQTSVGSAPIRQNSNLRSKILQLQDLMATIDPAIQQGTKT